MDTLIADLLTLAREGERVSETESVRLSVVVESCWETVETANATLAVEEDLWLRADESRFRQLVENLVRNAVEHGGDDVLITVGALGGNRNGSENGSVTETSDEVGFFVEDDGPDPGSEPRRGVRRRLLDLARGDRLRPPDRRTGGDGPRLVGPGHGGSRRGARFEVTGVEPAE